MEGWIYMFFRKDGIKNEKAKLANRFEAITKKDWNKRFEWSETNLNVYKRVMRGCVLQTGAKIFIDFLRRNETWKCIYTKSQHMYYFVS